MIYLKNISKFIRIDFLIILISLFLISGLAKSQNNCGNITLSNAKKNYETGKFNDVISSLNQCLAEGFNKEQKIHHLSYYFRG